LNAGADGRGVDERSKKRAQGRKFGLTVGTAFVVLAGVAYWRGALRTATVLGSLGGVLLLAGLVAPGSLGPVERAWMGLAHAISRITTPIIMGILYFGLFTVIGGIKRTFGRNSLVRPRTSAGSFWVDRPESSRRGDLRRQF
jgi:hypothetical protein